jgi:hypothetical protein
MILLKQPASILPYLLLYQTLTGSKGCCQLNLLCCFCCLALGCQGLCQVHVEVDGPLSKDMPASAHDPMVVRHRLDNIANSGCEALT